MRTRIYCHEGWIKELYSDTDYEFSADGIMFADRTPKPAMQEVKYYYGKYE